MLSLLSRFNAHDGEREALYIQEGVNHKVLLLIDEALSQLLDDLLFRILLVKQLDVLSSRDLPFPDDSLLVLCDLRLMIVDKGVVLSDLPHNIVDLLVCCEKHESLLNIKVFLLHISRDTHIIIVLVSDQKEFLYKSRGRGQTDKLEDSLEAVVDLVLESLKIILNDTEMWVADPGIDELLIEHLSIFNSLVSCLIVTICVELDCSLGCCD